MYPRIHLTILDLKTIPWISMELHYVSMDPFSNFRSRTIPWLSHRQKHKDHLSMIFFQGNKMISGEIHLVSMEILTSFQGNPSYFHGNLSCFHENPSFFHGNTSCCHGNQSCFHRNSVDLQSSIKICPWTCVKVSIIMSKFHGYLSMDPRITKVCDS